MQTLENGIDVMTPGDTYNPVADITKAFKQVPGAIRVNSQTERDAKTKYDGLTVQRMDLEGQPYDKWKASTSQWLPLAPVTLTFNGNYRQIGTWFTEPVKAAGVSRSERRVNLSGGLANNVAISFLANTEYVLATFPVEYAPKNASELFPPILVNAYQCNLRVTPSGQIRISFLVAVPSQAIGAMVFPLSGLSWDS